MTTETFPFAAVVGAEEPKLALLLASIDRGIGGVLLRGDKGAAKSTLARGLAQLLPEAPFVELPLGATEERVTGSIDLAAALTVGEVQFQPGLLAQAHGGVLYVDEINLLADHLVDVLLDAAASGMNRVERDGVSHTHPARFVLIGSMNPEEGDLRPQLLDRFGLAVDLRNPTDPVVRTEVVRRRLSFDQDPGAFSNRWTAAGAELAAGLAGAKSAEIPSPVLEQIAAICVAAGAESLRADIVLSRAAAAHAGWQGRTMTEERDVRAVAHLVLAHRQRRDPFGDHRRESVDEAVNEVLGAASPPDRSSGDGTEPEAAPPPDIGQDGNGRPATGATPSPSVTPADDPPPSVAQLRAAPSSGRSSGGRRSVVEADRGRTVGSRIPNGNASAIAVLPTLQANLRRRASAPETDSAILGSDLREPIRRTRTGNLVIVAVDASGSMGADERMGAVKGALLGLLIDAYQRRDRVALVTFQGEDAIVALRPTASIEVARRQLEDLPTGGRTPLARGITTAAGLAERASTEELRPILVLVTDGRATAGPDPWNQALDAARGLRAQAVPTVVVDVESGPTRLGLAADLAAAAGGVHLPMAELTASSLEGALRQL